MRLAEVALGFALLGLPAAVVIAGGNEIAGEARVIDVVRDTILLYPCVHEKGTEAWPPHCREVLGHGR